MSHSVSVQEYKGITITTCIYGGNHFEGFKVRYFSKAFDGALCADTVLGLKRQINKALANKTYILVDGNWTNRSHHEKKISAIFDAPARFAFEETRTIYKH